MIDIKPKQKIYFKIVREVKGKFYPILANWILEPYEIETQIKRPIKKPKRFKYRYGHFFAFNNLEGVLFFFQNNVYDDICRMIKANKWHIFKICGIKAKKPYLYDGDSYTKNISLFFDKKGYAQENIIFLESFTLIKDITKTFLKGVSK